MLPNDFNMKILGLFVLIFLVACYPAPWEKQVYESTIPKVVRKAPFTQAEFAPYLAGSDLLHVFVIPNKGTSHSGGSPYRIIFQLLNGGETYSSVLIHDVSVMINNKAFDDYSLMHNGKEVIAPFNPSLKEGYLRMIFSTTPIDIDHTSGHLIRVIADIEVFSKEDSHRNTITYIFEPKSEKGFWGQIEV